MQILQVLALVAFLCAAVLAALPRSWPVWLLSTTSLLA